MYREIYKKKLDNETRSDAEHNFDEKLNLCFKNKLN